MRKFFLTLALAVSTGASAQPYPSKPIELVVHTSAGSGGDVVSRAVAEIIRRNKFLPQMMNVNNRVGGAGIVGFGYLKSKKGDPYVLMSITGTVLALAYRDVGLGLENYMPMALFAIDPQTIMVPANSPYKTFNDLMAAIKSNPDTLVGATTSTQGTGRLVIHKLEKHAPPGTRLKFVTFKGGSEAVTSTAGGHTGYTTENLGEGYSFVEGKQLRVLAITGDKRLPHVPDIPTLQELGYPIVAGTMRGFAFGAGVPKEAVAVMETALKKAHDSPEWKELARRNLYQDIYLGPADLAKFLQARMVEYREFYDAIGLGKKP